MNIYDALKSGSTAEELKVAFQKELDDANARLAEEEAAALKKEIHEEALRDAREEAVNALIDYVAEVFGEDFKKDESAIDSITDAFKEFEKEMSNFDKLTESIFTAFEKTKDKKPNFAAGATTTFSGPWKITWK